METPGVEDEQILEKPSDFELIWLHNPTPEKGSKLAQKAKAIALPENGSKFGYLAAEFDTVKELRTYFRKELAWTKAELYAYSFWKAGVAEDRSVSDRREEKESI